MAPCIRPERTHALRFNFACFVARKKSSYAFLGECRFAAGSIELPTSLEAGQYNLEVIAYDRLEKATAKPQSRGRI